MEPWFESRKLLQRAPLGRGKLLYIPHAAAAHAALVAELNADPLFLLSELGREHYLFLAEPALV